MYLFKIFSIIGVTFFLSACSHKIHETSVNKQTTITKLPKQQAPLLTHLGKMDRPLADKSAFYPLVSPADAFAARLFLIDQATTSIDVQYYIYNRDDTFGKVFSGHLLMAAQRGVRVRILIDDLTTAGKDKQWQRLISHPNIELRFFNPNMFRTVFRNLALLFNVNQLGKRMHNKSLIADGCTAIIGGRNIGDDYFASSSKRLFLDYDILTIGNVVPDISRSFDLYWNSHEAVSSTNVLANTDISSYLALQEEFKKVIYDFEKSLSGKAILQSNFNHRLSQKNLTLTVAEQTDFYYDQPTKVSTDERDTTTHISSQFRKELQDVQKELIIISPYFIPSDAMMLRLKEIRERGVKVTVITNSLASTDVFPVYSGYYEYIKRLVEMGVELYELKPNSFKTLLSITEWANPNSLSLHTKMIISDDSKLGVGSANIDPRSNKLNTELFMIIHSHKLVKAEKKVLKEVLTLENFYRLSWGEHPYGFDEDTVYYGPIWHTLEKGKSQMYYTAPHSGFWRTLGTNILSLLPIKGFL